MPVKPARLVFHGVLGGLLLCHLAGCKEGGRSSGIKCGENCASYQHTDSLPEQTPQGTIRLAIGGDSRDDRSGVVPWAFKEARRRGAKAFFFLGDLELTPAEDELFLGKLNDLGGVPFYPVMGNHEVASLAFLRRSEPQNRDRGKKFKPQCIKVPVNLTLIHAQI